MAGSYIFELEHEGKAYFVDATDEAKSDEFGMGRLMNHSRLQPNVFPRKIVVDGVLKLAFFAGVDMSPRTELLYDYGDRAGEKDCPWLAN